MFQKTTIAAISLLAAGTLFAAQPDLVVPAVGSGPGAAGSQWKSELVFHNAGADVATATVTLHSATAVIGTASVSVGPRSTVSYADAVAELFGKSDTFGALAIDVATAAERKLAVSSRAVNLSSGGEYGQDVPALDRTAAMVIGDTAVITGPRRASLARFNAGVFASDASTVQWSLVRGDGSVAATKTISYLAGEQKQYNAVVDSLFGSTPADNDVVHAKVTSGSAYFYGSTVNNATGDPSFVHAVRTRENLQVIVNGIDLDENGSVDVRDANGDARIDQPIEVQTRAFPNFFRIIASDPEGAALTYQLIGASSDVRIFPDGTIQWAPGANLAGTSSTLTVRISDGIDSIDVVIPVIFR